ncbi:MAG: YjbE family putative metal transport protein [Chloroflexota bacterium]|nr:YjbE family putative metal transport protein [Chloroflexota bacterium]
MELESIGALARIIAFDLILSGDNAVVIGLAANRLSADNRRRAILVGGAGAVILRIVFTALVAYLLDIPLLQAAGGLLLIWIAFRLAKPHTPEEAHIRSADSLIAAIKTIIVADAVMSLDNMLAVGAAAEGELWLLLFGLGLSIPILLFGSELISRLLSRYPILVWVGILILLHTAIHMATGDSIVEKAIGHVGQVWVWVGAILLSGAFYLAMRTLYRATPRAHRDPLTS